MNRKPKITISSRLLRTVITVSITTGILSLSALAQGFPFKNSPTPSQYPGADYIVLSESVSYSLNADGLITKKVRRVEKVLTYEGMDRIGDPKIPFNKRFQELSVTKLRTYTPDGRKVDAKPNSFNEMTPFALAKAPVYTDWRQMVCTKVGLEPGCVAVTEYTLTDKVKWQKWLESTVLFSEDAPVLKKTVSVTVPEDTTVNWHAFNCNTEPETQKSPGYKTMTWHLTDLPMFKYEELSNHAVNFLPTLVFTTCPDWKHHSDETGKAVSSAINHISDALKTKVETLVEDSSDLTERIEILHKYVAENINTVHWPAEDFNYLPRSASDIFDSGYGTALDKSVLLCAMLKQIGVDAAPAAFGYYIEGGLDPSVVPSMSTLSEIIVRVNAGENIIWMDPLKPLSSSSHKDFVGVKGLPLLPGYNELHTLNGMGVSSTLSVLINAKADEKLGLSGTGTITLMGGYSPYYKIKNSESSRKSYAEGIISEVLPGAEIKSVTTTKLTENTAIFQISFSVPSPEINAGIIKLSTSLPSCSLLRKFHTSYKTERDLPLVLKMAGTEKVKLTIELTNDTTPLFIPENLKVNEKAASFHRAWTRDGQRVTVEYDLKVPSAVIPADEYSGFRKLYTEAMDLNGSTLLFQR